MQKNSKIYIAGHRGLVGSAIVNNLKAKGYINLVFRTHTKLDLKDQQAVAHFFQTEKPSFRLKKRERGFYVCNILMNLPSI